jgi:hypothetical protein
MKYGSEEIFSRKTHSCIMDTGTSLIAVPNQEFNALTKAWKLQYAGVTCSSEICYAAITCT